MSQVQTIDFEAGFVAIDGLESVRQRVVQMLHMNLGEWFLNTRAGTPYLTQVFGQRFAPLAEHVLRRQIEAVPGVDDVLEISSTFDRDDRRLRISVVVQTDGVELPVEAVV